MKAPLSRPPALLALLALSVLFPLSACSKPDPNAPPILRSTTEYNETLAKARDLSIQHVMAFEQGLELDQKAKSDLKEAERLCKALIGYSPASFGPYVLSGITAQARGDKNQAKQRLEQAMRLKPEKPNAEEQLALAGAHMRLSVIYLEENNLAQAEANARAALTWVPDSATMLVQLAAVHVQQKKLAEARQILDNVLKKEPTHSRAKQLLKFLQLGSK